jgi:hypothetical protein
METLIVPANKRTIIEKPHSRTHFKFACICPIEMPFADCGADDCDMMISHQWTVEAGIPGNLPKGVIILPAIIFS